LTGSAVTSGGEDKEHEEKKDENHEATKK